MFYRIKSIIKKNGKRYCYFYLVKSKWDKKEQQSKQKIVAYLGRVSDLNCYDAEEVLKRDGYACVQCERMDNLTISYIIPLCLGGSNHITNLQTLCLRCNKKKGKTIHNYKIAGLLEYKPLHNFYW